MLFWLFEGRLINIERYDGQIYIKLPVATIANESPVNRANKRNQKGAIAYQQAHCQ